ncbi:hypothetical protein E5163_08175 [Marinicauda algicola]|uniref:Oxidoreductase molybdopterin-binding domain-containing protein n=1 Tax=Marinicauda algicola TaxID=2029849 RepID=A0A4S2H0R1_9PROT|nr:molybdopterin-dependent oxidoreductase [Marinicauda algicola]TGY89095.1 hypothetical protein E5163_08175 [Marinicauda algicola]
MTTIRNALLAALAAFWLAACGGPPADVEIDGPVILTVAGAGLPSEEPPAYEGLYAAYGIETGQARAFTRRDLASLRWRQIRTDFPAGGAQRVFEGPRLSDVLGEAGLADRAVVLTAFDGYQAEVEADLIARHEPILALRADGEPLATGGLGPLMLVWPRGERGALAGMSDDLWPWGIFAISPGEAPDAAQE